MHTSNRPCWWCGGKLMAVSHAEVTGGTGHVFWVHKVCEADARRYLGKGLTAQPPQDLQDSKEGK